MADLNSIFILENKNNSKNTIFFIDLIIKAKYCNSLENFIKILF